MSNDLNFILVRMSQISILIPVISGMVYYARLNVSFKVFWWFVLFSMFMEYFATWYSRHIATNNLPPLHFYTIIELGFISYVLCRYLFHRWKGAFVFIVSTGIIIAVLNATVWGSLHQMNHVSRSYESMLLVIGSLLFFRKSLNDIDLKVPVFRQPMFWFSTGVFLYFSVNLLFFMLYNNVLVKNSDAVIFGQILHSVVNISTNLLFAQSFRCFRKTV